MLLPGFPVPQEICLNALFLTCLALVRNLVRIVFRERAEIIAENPFLRRQLALYRNARPADVALRRPQNSGWSP